MEDLKIGDLLYSIRQNEDGYKFVESQRIESFIDKTETFSDGRVSKIYRDYKLESGSIVHFGNNYNMWSVTKPDITPKDILRDIHEIIGDMNFNIKTLMGLHKNLVKFSETSGQELKFANVKIKNLANDVEELTNEVNNCRL